MLSVSVHAANIYDTVFGIDPAMMAHDAYPTIMKFYGDEGYRKTFENYVLSLGKTVKISEKIKLEAGCCWEPFLEEDDEIIVPGVGGRPPKAILKSQILSIIRPRIEETFKLVKEKMDKLPLSRSLGGGVVLTGGGAQLLGAAELASHVFRLPVRIGSPLPVGGLVEDYRNPAYATAVGLVIEGYERQQKTGELPDGDIREKGSRTFWKKIDDWMGMFFGSK
jgi:cell division protein FtsA